MRAYFILFCCYVLCSVASYASNIIASINSIPMLNGKNFKSWKENVMIVLGVMDLELVLRVAQLADLTDQSLSSEKREMERWDHLNRMSLMIMKRAIQEAFKGTMSDKSLPPKSSLRKLRSGLLRTKRLKLVCFWQTSSR